MLSSFRCIWHICALEMVLSLLVVWVADVLMWLSVLTIPLTVSSLSKDIEVSDRQAIIWCRTTGGLNRYFRFKYSIVFNTLRLVLRSQLNSLLSFVAFQPKTKATSFISSVSCSQTLALHTWHFTSLSLYYFYLLRMSDVFIWEGHYWKMCICDILISIYGNVFHLASGSFILKFDLSWYTMIIIILWFIHSGEKLLKGTVTSFLYLWSFSCLFYISKVKPVGGPFTQPQNRGLRVKKFALVMISFWSVCPQRDTWWESIYISTLHTLSLFV